MDSREATLKLVALLEENHEIVRILIGKLAVKHTDSTFEDPSRALGEVLSKQKHTLLSIPYIKFKDARKTVLDANSHVKGSVDPGSLDFTLSVNLLRYIQGLIPKTAGNGHKQPCSSSFHVDLNCQKKHTCRISKNTPYGRHPAWTSFHECNSCQRSAFTQGSILVYIFILLSVCIAYYLLIIK